MGAPYPTQPAQWNVIPELTAAPNLWEGLHSLWVFEDDVSVRDLISGQVHNFNYSATESITTEGRIITPGGIERFTLDRPIPRSDIDANGISVFVRGLYPSTHPNFRQVFSLESTASSGNQQYISMRTAGTGDMSVRRRLGELFNSESTVDRIDDTPWSGIISHDGYVNAEISLNGERFTRAGAVDATVTYDLNQIEFGQQGAALAIVAIWNRQLSEPEFVQLEEDPYCMIRPGLQMMTVPPALAPVLPPVVNTQYPTKPARWNVQPALTAAPNLFDRCVMLRPYWDYDTQLSILQRPRCIVTNLEATGPTVFYPDLGWNSTPYGLAYQGTNFGQSWPQQIWDAKPSWEDTRAVTVIAFGAPENLAAGNATLLDVRDAASQRIMQLFASSATSVRSNGGDDKFSVSLSFSEALVQDDPIIMIGIFKENESVELYIKNVVTGEEVYGIDLVGSAPDIPFDYLLHQARPARGNQLLNAIWTRALGAGEVRQLLDDPFAMIRPGPLAMMPGFEALAAAIGSIQIAAPRFSAYGSPVISGLGAVDLSAPDLTASGSPVAAAAGGVASSGPAITATGSPIAAGDAAIQIDGLQMAATGSPVALGSIVVDLDAPRLDAAGSPIAVGSIAMSFAEIVIKAISRRFHLRQQIREQAATTLSGLATTGSSVFVTRARSVPEEDLPALLIYTQNETARELGVDTNTEKTYMRTLDLVVEGLAQGVDVDDTLDAIALEIEEALEADPTLGNLVWTITLEDTAVEVNDEGRKESGKIRLIFNVNYHAAAKDPTIAL